MESINLNMTEACAEALAALKRMWEWSRRESSGSGDRRHAREVFSLHWIRNDTGVPMRCEAAAGVPLRASDLLPAWRADIALAMGLGSCWTSGKWFH